MNVKWATCNNCYKIVKLVTVIILISYWDIRELARNSSKKGSCTVQNIG